MKELLEYILQNIVEDFSQIKITEASEGPDVIVYNISADEDQKGRIIGREGRIIKSIRNILGVKAAREGRKVFVKVE